MSNHSKDHTSIRVHAPPGGHSNNIFGGPDVDQSALNKKKHTDSDIFGARKETNEPAPAPKQNRSTGNNIFGTEPQETNAKPATIAGQFKQTQMKSNIFGSDDTPVTRQITDKNKSNIFGSDDTPVTRQVTDKNKSNIFGVVDDEQNKRQGGGRQGLRDPNASRMGYNPINGELYSAKDNGNVKQSDAAVVTPTESNNNNNQKPLTNPNENANEQKPTDKQDNPTNGNNPQKNVHTSVRVFHPPGGKSNGPLW